VTAVDESVCLPSDADTKTVTAEKYPQLNVLPNFLTPALMNPNAIVHPSIIFGAFHDWDGTAYPEQPLFYQGMVRGFHGTRRAPFAFVAYPVTCRPKRF
jgi:hypothetical protein